MRLLKRPVELSAAKRSSTLPMKPTSGCMATTWPTMVDPQRPVPSMNAKRCCIGPNVSEATEVGFRVRPRTGSDPGALGVVGSPLAAQHLTHLADGGLGAQRLAHRRQQVVLPGRSGGHGSHGRLHGGGVAAGTKRLRASGLAALRLGIDRVQL